MYSFCLNNGFRLQKTNRAARHWKQRPKKPFYRVSRDKILHNSWSISAALARGFSDRHFEWGEGRGDEVGTYIMWGHTVGGRVRTLQWTSILSRGGGSDTLSCFVGSSCGLCLTLPTCLPTLPLSYEKCYKIQHPLESGIIFRSPYISLQWLFLSCASLLQAQR